LDVRGCLAVSHALDVAATGDCGVVTGPYRESLCGKFTWWTGGLRLLVGTVSLCFLLL